MSGHAPPAGLSEHDFETIEDAVMETARGRWFLREYARRMRNADTNRLLDALSRIERAMTGQSAVIAPGARVGFDLAALEERRDRLSDLAANLREQGYDGDLCGRITREASALADIIDHMRDGAQPSDTPAAPAPRSSDEAFERQDPHASALVTIEAQAVAEEPLVDELPPMPEPALLTAQAAPDLAALAVIDELPFREKLALFS